MGQLTIHNSAKGDFTCISNCFLDTYMPQANGEFVKIYLYLLRNCQTDDKVVQLSSIADTFNCTENDVLRAFKYWKNTGLLEASFDDQDHLTGIALLPLPAASSVNRTDAPPSPEQSSQVRQEPAKSNISKEKALTASKIKELKDRDEVVQLLFIAEQYLGKTLTHSEAGKLLYFYDELNFSAELMEYLIEYCVSKGSRSIRYIEKVALSWAEQHITTVEEAKEESSTYHRNYFSILRAFGIKNRNPVEEEIRFMNLWLNEYAFTQDIIAAACSRTVLSTGQPNFAYADGILKSWKQKGVKHLPDIDSLDESRRQASAAKAEAAAAKPKQNASKNKFNNFHQRAYDVEELEKQLLK